MYLRRKTDEYLINWKNDGDHKPLIIKGARQVGKTETIRQFARKNYRNTVEINFALEPQFRSITEEGYTSEHIIRAITRIDPSKKFIPNDTLIFFDEIQDHPDIATALKSFSLDGRYDVICSGSLLGLYYKKIESNSVGYKTDHIMHSMDFEEFLWAKGYGDDLTDSLLSDMLNGNSLSSSVMTALSGAFLDYTILGGMPSVVLGYIEKANFEGSLSTQKQLLLDYEEDVMKYADGMDKTRILNVFRHIPVQLAKENKKFQITKVSSGARFKDYRGAIEWLQNSGIINISYCLNVPELPLKGNYDETKYKIYMADTGLLISMLDDEAQYDLRVNKNIRTYKGGIYENLIAETLTKMGFSLFYYRKEDSTLEEDFFVRTPKNLIPVEVKATNGNAKSLRELIRSPKYPEIEFGIKFADGNIGYNDNVYTFPHFSAFLLKEYLQNKYY